MKGAVLAHHPAPGLAGLSGALPAPLVSFAGQPLIAFALQKLMLTGIYEIAVIAAGDEALQAGALAHIPVELQLINATPAAGAEVARQLRGFCGEEDCTVLEYRRLFQEPLINSHAYWLASRSTGHPAVLAAVSGADDVPTGYVCSAQFWESDSAAGLIDSFALPEAAVVHRQTGFACSITGESSMVAALAQVMGEFGAFQVLGSYAGSSLQGPVGIVRGSVVADSELHGPVLVAGDCDIRNCTLGPNVAIEHGCRLTGCTLADCQVQPGTVLAGVTAESRVLLP